MSLDPYGAPAAFHHPPVSPAPASYQPGAYSYLPPPVWVPARPASSAAVTALVLGVLGLFFSWCSFGLPSLGAVLIGHVALGQTRDGQMTGRGMATAGVVMGYVIMLPSLVLGVLFLAGSIGAAA